MDSDYDSPPESIYEEPPDDSDADENYVPDDDEEELDEDADDVEAEAEDAETQIAGDFECVIVCWAFVPRGCRLNYASCSSSLCNVTAA